MDPKQSVLFSCGGVWDWAEAKIHNVSTEHDEYWKVANEYQWILSQEQRRIGVVKDEYHPVEEVPGRWRNCPIRFYFPTGEGDTFASNFGWANQAVAETKDNEAPSFDWGWYFPTRWKIPDLTEGARQSLMALHQRFSLWNLHVERMPNDVDFVQLPSGTTNDLLKTWEEHRRNMVEFGAFLCWLHYEDHLATVQDGVYIAVLKPAREQFWQLPFQVYTVSVEVREGKVISFAYNNNYSKLVGAYMVTNT